MLREFATQEEIVQYQNTLYDFNTDVTEEEYVPLANVPAEEEEKVEEKETSEEEEEDMDVKSSLEKTATDDEE
jgi:hypothetical protein